MRLKSQLVSATTRNNFSYIASRCLNCGVIGMLREFATEHFCSYDCQKSYNKIRFSR